MLFLTKQKNDQFLYYHQNKATRCRVFLSQKTKKEDRNESILF